jgi:hypothetical protein
MANINLTTRATTNRAIDLVTRPSHENQRTLPAAEAIVAGAPVRLDTTNGRWTNANGTVAGEARWWGIAMRTAVAGESVTAVRSCLLDGYDLATPAYDAPIYLSDTDGRLGDTPGTVATAIVGKVVAGTATTLGTAYDKLLEVGRPPNG